MPLPGELAPWGPLEGHTCSLAGNPPLPQWSAAWCSESFTPPPGSTGRPCLQPPCVWSPHACARTHRAHRVTQGAEMLPSKPHGGARLWQPGRAHRCTAATCPVSSAEPGTWPAPNPGDEVRALGMNGLCLLMGSLAPLPKVHCRKGPSFCKQRS